MRHWSQWKQAWIPAKHFPNTKAFWNIMVSVLGMLSLSHGVGRWYLLQYHLLVIANVFHKRPFLWKKHPFKCFYNTPFEASQIHQITAGMFPGEKRRRRRKGGGFSATENTVSSCTEGKAVSPRRIDGAVASLPVFSNSMVSRSQASADWQWWDSDAQSESC